MVGRDLPGPRRVQAGSGSIISQTFTGIYNVSGSVPGMRNPVVSTQAGWPMSWS